MAYIFGDNPSSDPEERESRPVCVYESGNPNPIQCFGTTKEAAGFKKMLEEDMQKNDFGDFTPAPPKP
jgi:hypothetical protein